MHCNERILATKREKEGNYMKVFISYSYDGAEHSEWVGKLADDLERYQDFHVVIDQYDLDVYKDKNLFMEDSVMNADAVLIIATDEYKKKADERTRGVGIETQLASQRHYVEMGHNGSSDFIVIQREKDSIPNYLSSKIYIDFTEDSKYRHSFKKLVSSLQKKPSRKRPPKLFSTEDIISSELTRIEDVLKIIYHKRTTVIDAKEGTDYSGSNRIKFELWEVKVPKIEHILVLYDHIIISQTIDRALELIRSKDVNLKSLTIIRVDDKSTSNLETEVKRRAPSINLSQFSLKGFIREFCIDSEFTSGQRVWEEPYFIDQPIYQTNIGVEGMLHDHAIPYLISMIESPTNCSAHLVLAEGGDGKSSLSSSLVNAINNPKSNTSKSAILLRVDEIRERISNDVANNYKIRTVHDIYDLFSLLLGKNNKHFSYPKISKNEFEVSVFCGNLVVVIDGLDELYSVFQERFDKDAFIESIQSLNDQLGQSSVILTSRGNIFSEEVNTLGDIQVCYLRGFDKTGCTKYFAKRFFGLEGAEKLKIKCDENVDALIKATEVEKISPFVVDLIANVNSEQCDGIEDDNYSLKGKPYPSNSEFKDKIVYHVLRREKKRQEVHITIKELVDLFCEIATEYGPSISLLKLKEICEIYFEKQASSVIDYLKINPLLQYHSDIISFRYHFLHEYFVTLFIIQNVIECDKSVRFINIASKYSEGMSAGYTDILKYFREHHEMADLCSQLKKLKDAYGREKSQRIEKAISFIVHLLLDIRKQALSKKELSELLFSCFRSNGNLDIIENLFIYGDGPSLDFHGKSFLHCGFHGYLSLLKSNLDNAFFSYSTIDIEIQDLGGFHITRETFDSTCRIGRLSRLLGDDFNTEEGQASNEEILRRFFRNFIENNSFVEKDVSNLRFPQESMSARSGFFREAIRQHVLYLSSDANRAGVTTRTGEKVVHNFITNNAMDMKIYKIMKRLPYSTWKCTT